MKKQSQAHKWRCIFPPAPKSQSLGNSAEGRPTHLSLPAPSPLSFPPPLPSKPLSLPPHHTTYPSPITYPPPPVALRTKQTNPELLLFAGVGFLFHSSPVYWASGANCHFWFLGLCRFQGHLAHTLLRLLALVFVALLAVLYVPVNAPHA